MASEYVCPNCGSTSSFTGLCPNCGIPREDSNDDILEK